MQKRNDPERLLCAKSGRSFTDDRQTAQADLRIELQQPHRIAAG
ncbi:hypothetical protein V1290_005345 [Bradyrhizobium sp. AZCC 1578]